LQQRYDEKDFRALIWQIAAVGAFMGAAIVWTYGWNWLILGAAVGAVVGFAAVPVVRGLIRSREAWERTRR
jgi:hypothetical protein